MKEHPNLLKSAKHLHGAVSTGSFHCYSKRSSERWGKGRSGLGGDCPIMNVSRFYG